MQQDGSGNNQMYAVDENGQPIGILQQQDEDGGYEEQEDTTDLNKDGSPDVELTEEQLVELLKNAD